MRRPRLMAFALAILALVSLTFADQSQPAFAVGSQIRTFVASTGSDSNPCTRTSPCRTFAAALAQTASGGEVVALDTGGYGTLNITQAVTITAAPGAQAFIAPSSGVGITVNAGLADTIILRGLTLNGQGAATGVLFQAGAALSIESSTINGFANNGIEMDVSAAADLFITDTVVRNNGGSGIFMRGATTAAARVVIVRVRAEKNQYGIWVADRVLANVKDSMASGNSSYGFIAYAFEANWTAALQLENCMSSANGTGITAGAALQGGFGFASVSNCMITRNGTGLSYLPGGTSLIETRSNNTLRLNGFEGSFSGTFAAQ